MNCFLIVMVPWPVDNKADPWRVAVRVIRTTDFRRCFTLAGRSAEGAAALHCARAEVGTGVCVGFVNLSVIFLLADHV
ncbi:hypothetical protein [Variovorax sp. LT1R16]|uniref:hypothetical protein n=1 Tax=Variovorax sp. LT1R16 TaxID=3443728 RepID=UPI003F453AD1